MHVTEADGVFQARGAKAIALAGALLGFAERGYSRWVNLAGTGSGALAAAYLACGYDAYDAELLLRSAPYSRFEDHGPGGPLFGGGWNLLRRGGLARGEYLRAWLADQLDGRTFGSLGRNGRTQLKVIAADVTRRRPVVFPDDLAGYRLPGNDMPIDPAAFQVAEAVRLSMLSPYLFEPGILVHHETALPSAIVGGLVPAPVSLFDALDRPLRPTFGVRAEGSRGSAAQGRRPLKLVSAAFDTALEAWDPRFAPPSALLRTCIVPPGEVESSELAPTPLEQTELVERGRRAARRFLDSFDVDAYRNAHGRRLTAEVPAY